jgi:hypothetical protein
MARKRKKDSQGKEREHLGRGQTPQRSEKLALGISRG